MDVGKHKDSLNLLLDEELRLVDEQIERFNKQFNEGIDREYSSWELKRYTRQRSKLEEAKSAVGLAFDFSYCQGEA
jgi:hypothetical protein